MITIKTKNAPPIYGGSIGDPANVMSHEGGSRDAYMDMFLHCIKNCYGIMPENVLIEFPAQTKIPTSEVGNE